jgi:uncharacterized protein
MLAVVLDAAVHEVDTPSGPARVHVSARRSRGLHGLLVLGHGAGGGVQAPDLLAVTGAMLAGGWRVARVEQPYRVKGHRAPEAAPRLDAAWIAVVRALRGRRRGPLVLAGRSSGARVACRTAAALRADAVVALAFPLHPPGKPERSRADELAAAAVPGLVVQGDRDPFGSPDDVRAALPAGSASRISVVGVPGDHSLRRAGGTVGALVADWLAGIGL